MRATNIHALAILSLSVANIWLAVQNVRWLIYVNPVRSHLPYGNMYSSFDPILEAPAILIGIGVAYFLLYRIGLNIWKIRYSAMFRGGFMARALSVNSTTLLVLAAIGISQWLIFFKYVPLDITAVTTAGAVAAAVSLYLEKKLTSEGLHHTRQVLPMTFLNSMATMWDRN